MIRVEESFADFANGDCAFNLAPGREIEKKNIAFTVADVCFLFWRTSTIEKRNLCRSRLQHFWFVSYTFFDV